MIESSEQNSSILKSVKQYNKDRIAELVRRKMQLLTESAFSFFRGTDELFAQAWRQLAPHDPGPVIQCTGDLHLENFGACESSSGDFRFEINDFDEAVRAPCSFDLVRCTASILLAGEEWGLSPVEATGIALTFIGSYSDSVSKAIETGVVGEIAPETGKGPVWDLLDRTARGSKAKMLDRVAPLKKGERQIVVSPEKHPPVSNRRRAKITAAVESYGEKIGNGDAYRVLDVTGRIAGIGSLGLKRYTVLIAGGGTSSTNRLLDVKKTKRSAAAEVFKAEEDVFPTEADRVVHAQLQLQSQPALGLGVIMIGKSSYRIREMIPDENRSSLNSFQKKPKKLREAVDVVGQLVGWSQVRGAHDPLSGRDERQKLAEWATGPGIEAVLAAAVRFADLTQLQFDRYCQEYRSKNLHKLRAKG